MPGLLAARNVPREVPELKAVVRQEKLGAFLQGGSPCRARPNQPPVPSVAVAEEAVEKGGPRPNRAAEAYTGNHIGRRGDRTP